MNPKKSALYGCAAVVVAPFVVAGGFVYRLGYDIAKFAYTYPKTTAVGILGSALLWQNGCMGVQGREYLRSASQGASVIAQKVLSQQEHVRTLESELEKTRAQAQKWEKQYLELSVMNSSASHLEEVVRESSPPLSPATSPPNPSPLPRGVLREEGMLFYFVKMNDTLEGISRYISGWGGYASMIASDNKISDSRKMPAGMLLRIREPFYTRTQPDVFSQVPLLHAIRLPGTMSVSEYFGDETTEVLLLNQSLGLQYTDRFPYTDGERILYFTREREEKK